MEIINIIFWIGVIIYTLIDIFAWFTAGKIRHTMPLWYRLMPGSGITAYFLKKERDKNDGSNH